MFKCTWPYFIFHALVMLVIDNIWNAFVTEYIDMFVLYLITNCHASKCNISSSTTMGSKTYTQYHVTTILLYRFVDKYKKRFTFFVKYINKLTLCSGVLEEIIISQLDEKLSVFYGTRSFITVSKKTRCVSISWAG